MKEIHNLKVGLFGILDAYWPQLMALKNVEGYIGEVRKSHEV
jgi:hypothetical protein